MSSLLHWWTTSGGDNTNCHNNNDDNDDDDDQLDILPFKLPHAADNTCLWPLSRGPPSV